jgi:hypothetical protein
MSLIPRDYSGKKPLSICSDMIVESAKFYSELALFQILTLTITFKAPLHPVITLT